VLGNATGTCVHAHARYGVLRDHRAGRRRPVVPGSLKHSAGDGAPTERGGPTKGITDDGSEGQGGLDQDPCGLPPVAEKWLPRSSDYRRQATTR